jgi:chemosensory pili system protein ChpA (sensor histidine kinase/response regulator)
MDQAVLQASSSQPTRCRGRAHPADISLGLGAGADARQPRIFWKIWQPATSRRWRWASCRPMCMSSARPRACSLQYATLAKGEAGRGGPPGAGPAVLLRAGESPPPGADAPALAAARRVWPGQQGRAGRLRHHAAVWPLRSGILLAQARKRMHRQRQGDLVRAVRWRYQQAEGSVADQFAARGRLDCSSCCPKAARSPGHSPVPSRPPCVPGRAPTELAMEVATSVLYLEAAFEDLDPTEYGTGRAHRAPGRQRLARSPLGGQPEALEPWMEELYRRVSDRQTMGSVVGELRSTLSELVEKSARPVLPQTLRTSASPARRTGPPDRRCVACCPCWAWTRPRRPLLRMRDKCRGNPGRPRSTSARHGHRHLREAGQQPRRARLPDRHAELPACAGQEAVCL